MRFKPTLRFLLFAGLCICLTIGEFRLSSGLASNTGRVVFTSWKEGNHEIYIMDSVGGNKERLTHNPANDTDPDWSPDGTKIAFASAQRNGKRQIYVMNADGSHLKKLTDSRDNSNPDWSPDGGKIVFTVHPDWINDWVNHIAVMDADGKNRERLEDHASQPSWSPDGQQIAFVSWKHWPMGGGRNEIYVMDADGQGVIRKVTHDEASKQNPSFSPDGLRIAYEAHHKGLHHIYVVGADGENPMGLTQIQKTHFHPAWSPDGETIAYYDWDGNLSSTIHLMSPEGRHIRQLSDDRDAIDFYPDISPLGLAVSPASKKTTTWGRLKKRASNLR